MKQITPKKRIQFITCDRVKDTYGVTSGLFNSASFVVNYLNENDFEIHCDGKQIGQVMFRTNEITVKKKDEKFGKEFKYDQLGKIKAEITSIIKDCCK